LPKNAVPGSAELADARAERELPIRSGFRQGTAFYPEPPKGNRAAPTERKRL